jgi:hypothetical protein
VNLENVMIKAVRRALFCTATGVVFSVMAMPAAAQERSDSAELERLRRQVEAVTREIEAMRLGQDVAPRADTSVRGFGPAASKVYRVNEGVSIGGYGEVVYENFASEREDDEPSSARDQIDALRAIVYFGYKFNDRLLFNSEIEVEHGSTDQGGSVSVEFAYVDYLFTPSFGARAGMVLVPMGFLNELHEPPIYLGTTRTLTESALIPSTWRENGVGLFGDVGALTFRAYVVNGLDGAGVGRSSGFSGGGLRGGRQKGARALIEDPGVVGRADFALTGSLRGLMVGGSLYYGGSAQGAETASGVEFDATTTIVEGHAQYRARGLDLRALYAAATLDDVAELNAVRGLSGASSIGEELTGWYVQAGYDVLRLSDTAHELTPYVRYEALNTQAGVPAGFAVNPANERTVLVLGGQWKPIMNVVVKADYQIHRNEAETGLNQFNVALGYLF